MKKIITVFAILSLVLTCIPISASAEEYVWDYYSFSLPEGFELLTANESSLSAMKDDSTLIALMRLNLSDYGYAISSSTIGEQTVLNACMETLIPNIEIDAPYEQGEKNKAAYIITSAEMESEGTSVQMTVIGLLKDNHMLIGYFIDSFFFSGRKAAIDFIQQLIVKDSPAARPGASSLYSWDIEKQNGASKVLFRPDSTREVTVSIPDSFDVYMPGMGEDCEVPRFFNYTPEEMDDYMATINATFNGYVLAVNRSDATVLTLSFTKIPAALGQPGSNGQLPEDILDSFYSGLSMSQGKYEKRTIGGRTFYVFPESSSGYKLRLPAGMNEVYILCRTADGRYPNQLVRTLENIAQSITIQ